MNFEITPYKKKWIFILREFANVCKAVSMADFDELEIIYYNKSHYNHDDRKVLNRVADVFKEHQNGKEFEMTSPFVLDDVLSNWKEEL